MKYLISFLCLAFIGYIGFDLYQRSHTNPATKEQLESVRAELAAKIDSVSKQVQRVELKTDSILVLSRTNSANVDSLKAGQVVIYDEVRKANSSDFWSRLNEYLP